MNSWSRRLAIALVALLGLLETGCGSGDDGGEGEPAADAGVAQGLVTYTAATGGNVLGDVEQAGEVGQSTTVVTAQAEAGYEFVGWSDGDITPQRTDSFADEPQFFVAHFSAFEAPALALETVNVTGLTVSWPAVRGADSYTLYVAREPIDDVGNIASLDGGQTIDNATSPSVLEDLSVGVDHYLRLVAHKGGVASLPSPELSGLPAIAGRYVPELADGTPDVAGAYVYDVVNNLTWERCLVGETWEPGSLSCSGTATEWAGSGQMTTPKELLFTLYYCADTDSFGVATQAPDPCPSASASSLAIVTEAFPSDHGAIADDRSNYDQLGHLYLTFTVRYDSSSTVTGTTSGYMRHLK